MCLRSDHLPPIHSGYIMSVCSRGAYVHVEGSHERVYSGVYSTDQTELNVYYVYPKLK